MLSSVLMCVCVCVFLQVFSFVHAQFTFFHQGFDLLRDLEPTMKSMAAQVLTSDLLLLFIHLI